MGILNRAEKVAKNAYQANVNAMRTFKNVGHEVVNFYVGKIKGVDDARRKRNIKMMKKNGLWDAYINQQKTK